MRFRGSKGVAIVAFALVVSGLAPGPAHAQTPAEAEPEVRYERRTSVVFGPLEMTGQQKRPDGAVVNVRPDVRFRSLVKVRTHFRRELLRSAHQL